jgi:hypothetical protein
MKSIYCILIMLLVSQVAAAEWFAPLTKRQQNLEALYVVITCIDWMQTKEFRAKGDKEMNPALGEEPSQERVDIMIGAAILGHIFVVHVLPAEYKDTWIISFTVIEAVAVYHNYSQGYGPKLEISFEIPF